MRNRYQKGKVYNVPSCFSKQGKREIDLLICAILSSKQVIYDGDEIDGPKGWMQNNKLA